MGGFDRKATAAKKAPKAAKGGKSNKAAAGTREGSKTAQALALLRRPGGAAVVSEKRNDGTRVYSIAK